ncbi:MAG: outer membrane protein assembly factor BamA, partial [Candidatus Aminicenantes bacterium]|nr:outer membrane protein assembly factor BamA [Candidatus Aminicenantes bacterium]
SIESWITGRDIFRESELDEDLASIKRMLQDHGFMNADVGEPRIGDITKRGINLKTRRMKKIIIPVQAGERYEVGDARVEGNEALSTETLENAIRLKRGQVYTSKDREKSVEEMTRLYLEKGYLYVRITPVETPDHDQKRIDVRFKIFEGEVTYLNRLEFKGNSFVKDKIMRKKILVREKDRFNFKLFEEGLLRINQLGVVKVEKEPELKPVPDDPTNIDVIVHVKERLKSDYRISGGYNGYGGLYLALDYATINLLGAGEILHFTFESGRKIKDYMFDLSEPYLLDYPINFGLNVYYRDNILPDLFNRRSIGVNFITGALIKGYWRANLTYGYENVNIKLPDEQREGEPDIDPVFTTMFGLGNYDFSSAIVSVFHTNLETPSFPYRKNLFSASFKFAGSFLGGDISIVKSRFAWSLFHRLFGEHAAGFYIDYQHVEALGDSSIPFWERYFLGGERSIRGYGVYSIGPRSELGTNIGGKKALIFNAEYIMPVFGPLYAVLFYDMGNAHSLDQRIRLRDMYSSAGLELRIFYKRLPLPIRIIFSYNNRKIDPDDSHFTFRFTVGTYF